MPTTPPPSAGYAPVGTRQELPVAPHALPHRTPRELLTLDPGNAQLRALIADLEKKARR